MAMLLRLTDNFRPQRSSGEHKRSSRNHTSTIFTFIINIGSILGSRVSSVELSVELSVVFMSVVSNMTLNSTIFNTDI